MENPKEGQSLKGEKHMKIRVFLVNDEKEFTDDLAKRHPLGQTNLRLAAKHGYYFFRDKTLSSHSDLFRLISNLNIILT